ncbi:MAG: cation:proton antiporter [Alphaproteobacteria bacterium]|jgi:CPA2 family monovalent cation:H+ antiporter-2|nr:cation:proton antiporter [Alphaproteobacteria bacterium]
MEGGLELTGIAIVAIAATLCGMAMTRLRQPPIVGYILAGVILGPSGFGFVADREQIAALAELGVLMLLYFVGMELSLRSFQRMWRIAVLSMALQLGASLVVMLILRGWLGWPLSHAVLFAFVLALSSTAVGVKMMEDVGALRQRVGRIAVGVLIAQDLAVAPMLLIVGGMAGGGFDWWVPIKVALAVGLLVLLIQRLSRGRKIDLPMANLMLAKVDLTPLAALTWCFAFAAIAGLVGLSAPFGAFLAGLVVGSSRQRHSIFETAKPIESILLMIFFLSIGLLVDLGYIWRNLGLVLVLWAFVTVFKTALNTGVLRLLGETWQHAFLSSLFLAQIGEFSFVLGAVAIDHAIIDWELHRLIVAVTVLSLVTSPFWMNSARRAGHRAAGQVDSIGRLLRLVYFREWRVTRRLTGWLVDLGYALLTRIEIAVERVRRRFRDRRQAKAKAASGPSSAETDADKLIGGPDA